MSKVVYVNKDNFESEITNATGPVLVDFFATWCGPCQMLGPVLDELSNEVEAKIVKIDIDESRDLAVEYGIRSVPTMKIFKDGTETETIVGFKEKEELKKYL